MTNNTLKYGAVTVFTLILLYFLTRFVDVSTVLSSFEKLSLTIIIAAFLAYIALNLVRAERYKAVLQGTVPYTQLTGAVFLQTLYNNLLPFRLGEASFPLLLRQEADVEDTVSAVIISRFFDAVSLILIFFFALLFVPSIPEGFTTYFFVFLAGLLVLLLMIPAFLLVSESLLRWLCFHPYIDAVVDGFLRQRREIYRLEAKDIAFLSASSLLIWALSIAMYAVIIHGLPADIPLSFTAIGVVFVVFSSLLPVQSFLQIGTVEIAWAAPLILFGIAESTAFTAGVVIHVVRIAFVLVLGGFGVLLRWR